jgi:hypothetical protein
MQGGYFATSWGWGALAFLFVAAVVIVVSESLRLSRYELALLAAFGAFVVFEASSAWWSQSAPAALREAERATLVVAGIATAMLVTRRHMRPLLAGVCGGITIAVGYGLATRLFPRQLGSFDSIAGYRLSEPLGYWNAVGILAVLGTLVAVGFAARARTVVGRAFGSAVPVLLVPGVYFTFGRGPWVALGLGLALTIALDDRRLQIISTCLLLLPFVGVAVWLSSREPDLNRRAAGLPGAATEGRHLAFALLALTAGAAFVGPAVQVAQRGFQPSRRLRQAYAGALVVLLISALGLGMAQYGSPQHITSRAYHAFSSPPVVVTAGGKLNQRLFSLSGNGRATLWRVAVNDFRAHPWLGSGAGTFELSWLRNRPTPGKVRDAHNLYVEVLAELGPAGLALLLLALTVPILASLAVRRHPLVPIALGAYFAYLVHAGIDWDWEMPAVTLAGLLCGVSILVVARLNSESRVITPRVRIGAVTVTLVVAAFAFVGLMGNIAVAASNNAATVANWRDSARHAGDAKRWMPWSSDPWRLQGEAQYVLGDFDAARLNFRRAIAKDPNNWLLWADLATVGTHGTWRAPARRALQLNPLAPELAEFRKALGNRG